MVEGPGATRNGRKLQVAVGKTVTVSYDEPTNEKSTPLPLDVAHTLAGQLLEASFTVGKELFLIFKESNDGAESESALRLHFGMNGSLNVRRAGNTSFGSPAWKQNQTPSLRLCFVGHQSSHLTILEAWDTTVTFPVSVDTARNKLLKLSSKDACSALFNAQEVFASLREEGQSLSISDALLHQEIFPGVGNIIKIESLHRAQIDPRRKVSSLSDVELRRIVRHARKFSMDWLNTGRAGTKLVYNQTVCGTCQGMTVKMQKIGGGSDDSAPGKRNGLMSRVTFWCTSCQPMTIEDGVSNQSTLNFPTYTADKENIPHFSSTQGVLSSNPKSAAGHMAGTFVAQCPQHGQKSIKLCRARNSTKQNTLRIFFTCKYRGCQYFSWADTQFPSCKCGLKTVLRVSKTERSGGRWFLSCAQGDKRSANNNGCGHFEWARAEHLAPLGSLLSPLL
ncbi:hypothetical protein HJC23_007113 [Cyclotella cryptica]|uniref:GRF-type domain-containing protein n=1 Tax=Cyclotella cryptica TaxID=29204 RepID=A0ABD3P281_9STRA|eukprot:CCRYP_018372-RB/>CCRYP_018372-RB protein AED:0.22 eAED:0.22 QI:241/-1/1/1/-1/1/1/71/448